MDFWRCWVPIFNISTICKVVKSLRKCNTFHRISIRTLKSYLSKALLLIIWTDASLWGNNCLVLYLSINFLMGLITMSIKPGCRGPSKLQLCSLHRPIDNTKSLKSNKTNRILLNFDIRISSV